MNQLEILKILDDKDRLDDVFANVVLQDTIIQILKECMIREIDSAWDVSEDTKEKLTLIYRIFEDAVIRSAEEQVKIDNFKHGGIV